MPRVLIESKRAPVLEIIAEEGGALIDVCDDHSAEIPFSCRTASCGTCRIDILEGMDELEPAGDEELDVLDIFGDDVTKRRLACQAKMRPGEKTLRIRPADEM